MIEDMLPTSYLNAIFGQTDPDSDEVTSIFEPTHVLNGGSGTSGDEEDFTLFSKDDNTYSAYGFQSRDELEKACMTKCWYVWDKGLHASRLEMYADNDWKWPIWVWDDPYLLQGFFPLTPLWFHENPVAVIMQKGEVSSSPRPAGSDQRDQ